MWPLTKEKSLRLTKIMYIVSSDTFWHCRLIFSACLFSLNLQACIYAFQGFFFPFMHSCAEVIPTHPPTNSLTSSSLFHLCSNKTSMVYRETVRFQFPLVIATWPGVRTDRHWNSTPYKESPMCLIKSHVLHLYSMSQLDSPSSVLWAFFACTTGKERLWVTGLRGKRLEALIISSWSSWNSRAKGELRYCRLVPSSLLAFFIPKAE